MILHVIVLLKSTRRQKAAYLGTYKDTVADRNVTTRRFGQDASLVNAFCTLTIADEPSTMEALGRCDNGSYKKIASPCLAECAVLSDIGLVTSIPTVTLQVSLKDGDQPHTFNLSRP